MRREYASPNLTEIVDKGQSLEPVTNDVLLAQDGVLADQTEKNRAEATECNMSQVQV